jgi:GntR family transcriptional regulator
MLPSIRNLAKDLKISVITTKRAYEELEKEGYINTIVGKGCFVAEQNIELIREENLRKIEAHISAITELASACKLSDGDIMEMIMNERNKNL